MTLTGAAIWGIPEPLDAPPQLPARAEVVIVGGGITGVALLDVLVRRGVDALLVERDHLAAGASGRNAGLLLAGVAENYARAVSRYSRNVAAAVWAFTLENHALTAASAGAKAAGHRRGGSLTVALDGDEAASLEEAATLLAEDRLPGELRAQGSPGWLRSLFNPADGEIDPVRLVSGIARGHAKRIFEHRPVISVDDAENAATVHLDASSIEAAAVILATNAWTSQLLPDVAIRPVRAQMLATSPVGPVIDTPVYADWGHRYWRQRADGSVLVGGFRHRALADEVGYEAVPSKRVQGHLDAQLHTLGVDAGVTHRWAGIMGFSVDGLPVAGLAPGRQRIHLCGGYTGHGMGFAINAANALSRALLDSIELPGWLDASRDVAVSSPPT